MKIAPLLAGLLLAGVPALLSLVPALAGNREKEVMSAPAAASPKAPSTKQRFPDAPTGSSIDTKVREPISGVSRGMPAAKAGPSGLGHPRATRTSEGLATSGIVSCDIGVVRSIVKKEHSYSITLDNGVTADIPWNHPVRNRYLKQPIRFPHFTNNAIALVTHANTGSDWLPARVAISLHASVVVKGTRYAFHDFTFEEFSKVYNEHKTDGIPHAYAQITSPPMPSGYTLFADAPFARHNYETIREILENPDENTLVDIVFSYSAKTGYILIYIQPTRFTPEYCGKAGISTEK